MTARDLALALVIVAIWGVNFAIIAIGLRDVSPLGLGVARFVLAALPWVFFIPRPAIPVRLLATYSLFIFVLQFAFLFTGMKVGMSAGLSSLILQLQVFFTIGLAVFVLGEKPTGWQLAGALLAFCGIGVVAAHAGGDVTLAGLGLLILGAASWGAGNIAARQIAVRAPGTNTLALVVWGCLFAIPPHVLIALVIDPHGLVSSVEHVSWASAGAIAYIVYLSTLFGFAVWSRLLGAYPVATVAPFTLLVPVFGFLGSYLLLGEPIQGWKLAASALVIAGLCVNLFGGRLARRGTA
ncbi:MAG TPA: EamA family transporter [Rhizobiaceae bacterium]|nr:EamA family transporter [Rhizobiaceae bacterium]